MNDDYLLILLRDCFTGGYTLPQFCIENKIRKPLFVAEKKFLAVMWEIYVQFRYDKQLTAQFALLDAPQIEIDFSTHGNLQPLKIKNISGVKPAEVDDIICLTARRIFKGKAIYLDALTDYFKRKTYVEIPLLNFLQRYPHVKLFMTKLPNDLNRYAGGTNFANKLSSLTDIENKIKMQPDKPIVTPLSKLGYTSQDFIDLYSMHKKIITKFDGTTFMEDNDHPFVKIKYGKRVTANQPAHFKNRIYFVGPCHYVGSFAPFEKTIESYLQQMLNEKKLPYRVENEGQGYAKRYQDLFYNLNALTPAPGDIIFVWIQNLTANALPIVDFSDAFDPPHDYRNFFVDRTHFNELGYKILAEKYFAFLTANNFFRDKEFKYAVTPPSASLRYPAAVRAWQCECQRGA